jgi:mannosyltransferase
MNVSLLSREEHSQSNIAGDSLLTKSWSIWGRVVAPVIFVLGFALRILYINHESVGFDEAFSMTVSRLPLREMLQQLVEDFVHPPLHYFVLRGWFKLFGFGVFQARLLSALFGTLAVVLVYFFAKYLFDRRTALLSSLLMAVSQLAIMLSQEPRPYAQFHFLVLSSCYLFVRALREERELYWWSFVGSSILMIYTDYFGIFVIAGLFLFAVIYRKRYGIPLWRLVASAAIALALYIPWMASGIFRAAGNSSKTFGGAAQFWAVHSYTILTAVNSFNNGKPAGLRESSPLWTFVVGGLLFITPVALCMKRLFVAKTSGRTVTERRDQEGIVITGLLWLLPLCFVIALGYLLHMQYNVRYVSLCVAPYYILVARGISELRSGALRWGLVMVMLAYSANALRANYFMRWKEDWGDAFAYVQSNLKEGDCGTFLPNYGIPQQWTITQRGRPSFRVIPQLSLADGLSECPRIWEVSWALHDNPEWWASYEARRAPLEMTHTKTEEMRYFGVRVSLYARKDGGEGTLDCSRPRPSCVPAQGSMANLNSGTSK